MRRPGRVSDSMRGMGAFVSAPPMAWSGWRLGIPGGPEGGQYHGFIAADSKGFRTADLQEIGPSAPTGEAGPPPHSSSGAWDLNWGGTALGEGGTVSDYVYRSPAEMRPRPNASGGTNTVRAFQEERSAGFAEAPGNYKALGAVIAARGVQSNVMSNRGVCPAWGCGSPPTYFRWHVMPSTGATSTVTQPPPPTTPVVGPTTSPQQLCPTGYAQDAAGNCVFDERNPYSLYLPDQSSTSPAPAPTVAANTCPTGYTQDPTTGNCLAPGQCPSGQTADPTTGLCTASAGITAWLGASTTIGGIAIPNALLAGGAALFAMKMMRK